MVPSEIWTQPSMSKNASCGIVERDASNSMGRNDGVCDTGLIF